MGNSNVENNTNEIISYNQLDKKRFEESSLDIYIIGKYNRLMDILIGEKKNNINEPYKQKYMSPESIQINKNSENFKLKEYSNEGIKQNLINNDKVDEINDIIKTNEKDHLTFNEYLNNFLEHDNDIIIKEEYIKKNSTFNWLFHFYSGKGFEIKYIQEIKEKIDKNIYDKKSNVLIIYVNSITEIYNIIDIFKTLNKEFHPLFLFIMTKIESESEIKTIYEEVKKYIYLNKIKSFNLRNITIKNNIELNKTSNKDIIKTYILDIYLYLINAWYYYNNIGDDCQLNEFIDKDDLNIILNEIVNQNQINLDDENKGKGLFNILLLGRPGVGKSTLVNLLCNSKRSLEGKGANVTKYISRYVIRKYNISLYDTPGFETDKDLKLIKELIKDLNEHLLQKRNQIHLIFYLLNSRAGRDFYDIERELLKLLMKNNIHIYFLLTFCPDQDFGNEAKEVIEGNLEKIFYELDGENGLIFFQQKTKIFPVHLLDEINILCPNFGIKTVLEECYHQFEKYIIKSEDINRIKEYLFEKNEYSIRVEKEFVEDLQAENKNEIFHIINKNGNILYMYIQNIDDVINQAKNNSKTSIDKYSLGCAFLGILGILTVPILNKCKESLFLTIAENFKKVIDNKERENLVKINSNKISELTLGISLPVISTVGNYYNIQSFGTYYMNKFAEELNEEGLNGLAKYLIDLIKCYNKAILGLKDLGKLFNK